MQDQILQGAIDTLYDVVLGEKRIIAEIKSYRKEVRKLSSKPWYGVITMDRAIEIYNRRKDIIGAIQVLEASATSYRESRYRLYNELIKRLPSRIPIEAITTSGKRMVIFLDIDPTKEILDVYIL